MPRGNTAGGNILQMPLQKHENTEKVRGLSRMQVLRIRQCLEAGKIERLIARSEGIPESEIVRVRVAELDRQGRHAAAVGVAVRGFLDELATLRTEIDEAILAEQQEAA